ncbi:DUF2948 family protein [Roseobacter sp. YSTF-M11]|uniref:DUF2948 family protein n=1 Tax=Roseobacter insulae TaxID=2859783 RepID=A0A9X1K355_9RHOB|nr:DUF2948 family protein [Roseobacter insulae]MBW4709228.1 DUF2948 family protein [Roseobacter insulae]
MTDARFEDSREAPLNLGAMDADDLAVISALVQDAVFPASEMRWDRTAHRFALLLNRFRWEEGPARAASPERVQSVLVFEGVSGVASNGIDRKDKDTVLSILSVTFDATDAPAGHVLLTLAGDGAIRLTTEALEATLKDVTKPYVAPSKKTPDHPD